MVRVLFLHGLHFLGKNPESSADAAEEKAYNDVLLRALYVLADLRGDHSIGWDGRNTTRWPTGVNCFPVAALLCAASAAFLYRNSYRTEILA